MAQQIPDDPVFGPPSGGAKGFSKILTPEDENLIDAILQSHNQSVIQQHTADYNNAILKEADPNRREYRKLAQQNGYFTDPSTGIARPVDMEGQYTDQTDSQNQGDPSELSSAYGPKQDETPEPDSGVSLPDNSPDYQNLIKQLNIGIDSADAAGKEAKANLFKAYNNLVPIEPITPLRILGDLVRVGANFAVQRNPGLAMALNSAGEAIKGYDPAYRDWQRRRAFAVNLLEGLSNVDMKTLGAKLEEPQQTRQLATELGVAGLREKGENARAILAQSQENERARLGRETQMQIAGLKVGKQNLLDQAQGLTNDLPFVRQAIEDLHSPYDDYSLREKIHVALQNVINMRHPKEQFNSSAVSTAEDNIYRMLSKELKK